MRTDEKLENGPVKISLEKKHDLRRVISAICSFSLFEAHKQLDARHGISDV